MSTLTTPQAAGLGQNCTADTRPLDLPALVGVAGWSRLPPLVQQRFSSQHGEVTYAGHMDMHCSLIGHIFAALGQFLGGPLTHMNVNRVPTSVRVSHNGQGGVIWERSFQRTDSGSSCVVRSTKELGADGGLIERTDGGLSMSLDVFEENTSLVFRSRRFLWVLNLGRFGRVTLPIPALLTPGICRVQHDDLGDGKFRFTLSMVHTLWGETFRQSGVFHDPA